MTSEQRTLIELLDITGIEFGCRKCGAKILYPVAKHDRLSEQCPNCYEPWFITPDNQHPSTPTTAEGVKNIIASLHKLAQSPLILAQVRMVVAGLPTSK